MSIDDLPPLREVIRRHGLPAQEVARPEFPARPQPHRQDRPRRRSARAAATVIEVGPGPGGLTRALLADGARRVIAIERDERCLAALAEIAAHYPGRLDRHRRRCAGRSILPRCPSGGGRRASSPTCPTISAPRCWCAGSTVGRGRPGTMRSCLMFQREVAERIVAAPGQRSLWPARACWPTGAPRRGSCSTCAPQAFMPPPKVTSSVVQLVPRAAPSACDRGRTLERVTEAAFGQRRKMLRQSLKTLGVRSAALLAARRHRPDRARRGYPRRRLRQACQCLVRSPAASSDLSVCPVSS